MIDYYIDNVNFKDFGVYVKSSTGVVDTPKIKNVKSYDWSEYNGQIVDLSASRIEQRTIKLSCFLSANDAIDFISKVKEFSDLFKKQRLTRLQIDLTEDVSLFFDCYLSNGITITKTWNQDGDMVGEFDLDLVEPEPVKKVIKFNATGSAKELTISFNSDDAQVIYWGDATCSSDLFGNSVSTSHTYAENKIYFALIHGNIDKISDFSTNGEILWEQI